MKVDEHSLQSPWIFSFYTKVLAYSGKQRYEKDISTIVNQLKSNQSPLVKTIGAGTSFPTKEYTISHVIKYGISSPKQSYLMQSILHSVKAKKVLELGTSVGIHTVILARSPEVEKVVSIEKNMDLVNVARSNIQELKEGHKVKILHTDVEKAIKSPDIANEIFDLIFIDANHTYEATINYYHQLKNNVSQYHGFLIFDDINWSPGMRKAWDEISNSFSKGVVIENDQLGLLCFQNSTSKQSYVLDF